MGDQYSTHLIFYLSNLIDLEHNPRDDFEYPKLPIGHPLRAQVLYRLKNPKR